MKHETLRNPHLPRAIESPLVMPLNMTHCLPMSRQLHRKGDRREESPSGKSPIGPHRMMRSPMIRGTQRRLSSV